MPKDIAIVLNNGSLNAAVATALAAQRYRLVTLFAETGPRNQRDASGRPAAL